MSLTLFIFHLYIKDKSAELSKKGEKNEKAYSINKIVSNLKQCVLCQKDSLEKLGSPFDSVQKSQIHSMIPSALAYRVLLNIAVCKPL